MKNKYSHIDGKSRVFRLKLARNVSTVVIIMNNKKEMRPRNPLSTKIVRYAFSPLLVSGVKELDIDEPKLSKPTPNGYSNPFLIDSV